MILQPIGFTPTGIGIAGGASIISGIFGVF